MKKTTRENKIHRFHLPVFSNVGLLVLTVNHLSHCVGHRSQNLRDYITPSKRLSIFQIVFLLLLLLLLL